ncbi:MAG: hypothetical protein CMH76_00205 [Nitrospinae bacterium]|nr:hypothetical protein [Nitrospinota bacterium]
MTLAEKQVQRYSHHILLPQVGGKGQERLLASAVAVAFGPGGAGAASVAVTYLAAAGVGRIGWLSLTGPEMAESGSLAELMALYAPGGPGESISALNPDARLKVIEGGKEEMDEYELLVLSGDIRPLAEVAARFEAAGKPVIKGSQNGWTGEVAMGRGDLSGDRLKPDEDEEPAPAAPTEGVLGSVMASAALCALLKGNKPVGSTVQARFDLSHGLFEEAVR